jgi:hypothetical protein
MLLNIYDTKEVFVKELQVILAERLLSSKEYDVEREVRPTVIANNRPATSNSLNSDSGKQTFNLATSC